MEENSNAFVYHINVLYNLASTNLSCLIYSISRLYVLHSRHPELHVDVQWALPLCLCALIPSAWNVLFSLVNSANWFWLLQTVGICPVYSITACANLIFITLFINYQSSLSSFLLESEVHESSDWISCALRVEWPIITYLGIRKWIRTQPRWSDRQIGIQAPPNNNYVTLRSYLSSVSLGFLSFNSLLKGITIFTLSVLWGLKIKQIKCLVECLAHSKDSIIFSYYYYCICLKSGGGLIVPFTFYSCDQVVGSTGWEKKGSIIVLKCIWYLLHSLIWYFIDLPNKLGGVRIIIALLYIRKLNLKEHKWFIQGYKAAVYQGKHNKIP